MWAFEGVIIGVRNTVGEPFHPLMVVKHEQEY